MAINDASISLGANKKLVKRYLAAEFCRQLLDENKYYSVLLTQDEMVKIAMKK
jgi:carboxyl-terminal processing protease